jgi:hypothetical protein
MKNNYNNLVRFYNRSLKKLSSLVKLGKNEYKQDILKRRIARLFDLLIGMQTKMKLSTATAALAVGFVLFQPNAATAQSYPLLQTNPFGTANVGNNWSVTGATDLDNDGDKDLLVGDTNGDFTYYQNVGTATVPSFTTGVLNPFGLSNVAGYYASVAFVDLDNDGDKDLMSGSGVGDFYYFQNTGTASAPAFAAPAVNGFGLVSLAATYSAPGFADLDNDGDKDMMSGDKNGDFHYYKNTGTASAPTFSAQVMNPFGLAITGGKYSTVAFADMNADGDLDLLSGRNDGDFTYFANTGSATVPAFATGVLNPFSLTGSTNGGSTPYFADMDNDGDLDLWSGEAYGDVLYYENTGASGIKNAEAFNGLAVYPNPTSGNVTLKFKESAETLSVEISNALGQVVKSMEITNNSTVSLPEENGMYFIKVVNSEGKNNIFKIVKN